MTFQSFLLTNGKAITRTSQALSLLLIQSLGLAQSGCSVVTTCNSNEGLRTVGPPCSIGSRNDLPTTRRSFCEAILERLRWRDSALRSDNARGHYRFISTGTRW